jgi:methyl-accepting chemotaxis protein
MGQPAYQYIAADEPPAEDIVSAIEKAIAGDYSTTATGSDDIARALNRLLAKLRGQAVSTLDHVVETSIAVNETSVQGANLLYGLRRVDDYSQSIAAAAEEMATTVAEIGRSGEEISSRARQAKASVTDGVSALGAVEQEIDKISSSVSQTRERLDSVHSLASNISTIADTIKKIAAQTNMLAINAAVEAARAGDAGKGFAVVASEVKALSDRTSAATAEIANIVFNLTHGMDSMTEAMTANAASITAGGRAVGTLKTAMTTIERNITDVERNSNDIGTALDQQNEAAGSVAAGVARIAAHGSKSTLALESLLGTMDRAQQALNALLGLVAETETPNKLVKLAQSDHVIWKRRLANMVIGREGLKAGELADHHNCRLGKWYDKVSDPRFKQNRAFAALQAPHCVVHQKGIQAVECFNGGDIRGALERISEVQVASGEVLDLLHKLEIE